MPQKDEKAKSTTADFRLRAVTTLLHIVGCSSGPLEMSNRLSHLATENNTLNLLQNDKQNIARYRLQREKNTIR